MKIKVSLVAWAAAAMLLQPDSLVANIQKTTHYFAHYTHPSPRPDLSPEDVIAIQLKAFQENDHNDTGIETVFSFAAPENKKYTGPLDFFKAMVKNPTYDPLLNLKKYTPQKLRVEGNTAQQIIVITDRVGKKAAYLFTLSKQTEGPYKDCWMTSSVIRLAYEDKTVNT
ncbi:DUF4864 domain-containing protein [Rhodocytophaga aerolata]|uniref:DUF4864 domain-containing protein n=1 Tax=Rhodocytophaga aerolata TaxID=455078 RepID=A0ABT8QYW1_9BACT|nr:DUF4864 domain-containing protein [Rhodocytophaga aerolata]MDO1445020.1 DUF4864 domain-containing protein [Rhodocytophaga aerolata]